MLGEKAELSYFCSCKLLYDKEADILRIKKSLLMALNMLLIWLIIIYIQDKIIRKRWEIIFFIVEILMFFIYNNCVNVMKEYEND